jgi:uncharacterized integral membrane protein (TIGR00697 family)
MDRKQRLYIWLVAIFVAALLTSDLIGGKIFRVAGIDLGVGMIPFPLTFVLTDVVNEFFGTQGARRMTLVGLGTAVFTFAVVQLAIHLPTSPESPLKAQDFANIFGWSTRGYIASIAAYLVGQLLDITVFFTVRRLTRERLLWLRSTGSTLVSQLVDTVIVTFLLFGGQKPASYIWTLVRNSYGMKVAIAVGMTPVIYLAHGVLHRLLHVPEALRADQTVTIPENAT